VLWQARGLRCAQLPAPAVCLLLTAADVCEWVPARNWFRAAHTFAHVDTHTHIHVHLPPPTPRTHVVVQPSQALCGFLGFLVPLSSHFLSLPSCWPVCYACYACYVCMAGDHSYAKTAFILNYDEGGQFFDHHWIPVPPMGPEDGASTVRGTPRCCMPMLACLRLFVAWCVCVLGVR
jgi:hypothetical protein